MARRTRLRHRLFMLTALNAAVLLGITLLLTWRARESHREVHELVSVDGHVVVALDRLQRMQSAFAAQLDRALAGDMNALPFLNRNYRRITQLLDDPFLQNREMLPIRSDIVQFNRSLLEMSNIISAPQPALDERREAMRTLSHRIESNLQALREERQAEVDRKIPGLELSATHTMFVALGIVYIVAIFSFVVVKLTLTKVVSPLENLTLATAKIKAGDYNSRVRVGGDHEIAELGARFNEMMDALAEMNGQLSHQARTDDLTALPNFRSFQMSIQLEIERASRYEEQFGVLVFDLDHFKKYNDSYGHLAGNEALQAVAGVIRKAIRSVDTPARYGGEEFASISPRIDSAGLTAIAERIRRGVEELPVPKGRTVLTVSVGGAIYPADGLTATELFAAADARLYEAKNAGRNRVIVPAARERSRNARLIS